MLRRSPLGEVKLDKLQVLMMPSHASGAQGHPLFDHAALHQIRAYVMADDALASRVDIDVLGWQPTVTECGTTEWALSLLLRQVAAYEPDVIAFSLYTWTIEACHRLARFLKAAMPSVLLVAGGPEVAVRESFVQEYEAFDLVVEGEGEVPIRRLLTKLLANERELTGIPGTSVRIADGSVVHTEPDQAAVAPEDLPDYLHQAPFAGPDDAPIAFYVSSRGCTRRCAYCLWPNQRMSAKSSTQVVAELRTLASRPDVEVIFFCDHDLVEVLSRDPETFAEVARVLREGNNPKVVFFAGPASANNPLFLQVLETFQTEAVYLGLLSANSDALSAVDRGWASKHLDKLRDVPEAIRKKTHVQLAIPLPGETPESYYAGLEELVRLGFYRVQVCPLQVLRGSGLHARAEEYGLKYFERAPYFCYETRSFSHEEWLTAFSVAYVLKRLDDSLDGWPEDPDDAWSKLEKLFRRRESLIRDVRRLVEADVSPELLAEKLIRAAGLSPDGDRGEAES